MVKMNMMLRMSMKMVNGSIQPRKDRLLNNNFAILFRIIKLNCKTSHKLNHLPKQIQMQDRKVIRVFFLAGGLAVVEDNKAELVALKMITLLL